MGLWGKVFMRALLIYKYILVTDLRLHDNTNVHVKI